MRGLRATEEVAWLWVKEMRASLLASILRCVRLKPRHLRRD
jgi:hypothetical protein